MKKAGIYCRVSTSDKQDYQRQINELTTIAKQHSFKDNQIEVYAESISGYSKKDDRPELKKLLQNIEDNPSSYGCVFTSEVSRIGRNPSETRRIIDRLTDIEVPVYIQSIGQSTIDKNGKRSLIINIILQVLMEYASLEAETFKARSKSGLRQSASQGKAGGGIMLPYGYMKDREGYLIVNDEEALVIKEVFRLYKDGNGIKLISNILNERRIPTRTNKTHKDKTIKFKIAKNGSSVKWSDKQVHHILRNELYIGKRHFKGEIFPAPSIIDEKIFNECKKLMQGKTHRNYLTTYTYLLKDLCSCGKCNRNYFARYKPVVGGDKIYICSSRLIKGGNCGNAGVNITLIESALYDYLIKNSASFTKTDSIEKSKTKLWNEIKSLTDKALIDQKQLAAKEKESKRLLDVYLSEVIDKTTFEERQRKIKNEISVLKERLELIERNATEKHAAFKNYDNTSSAAKMLIKAKGNRNELQAIYKEIIERVTIDVVDRDTAVVVPLFKLKMKTPKLILDLAGVKKKEPLYQYKNHQDKYWITIDEKNLIQL